MMMNLPILKRFFSKRFFCKKFSFKSFSNKCLALFLILFIYGPFLSAAEETKKSETSSSDTAAKASSNVKTNADTTTTQMKELKPFTAVNLSGVGNLYITQSKEENFTVEAPDPVLPLMMINVRDNTLFIDLKNASKYTDAKINYYLNVKNLNRITSLSSSTIFINEPLQADTLELSIGNLGEAHINVKVNKLLMKIDGGGKMIVNGSAVEQYVVINGAGEMDLLKLVSTTGTIKIIGSGEVKTKVTKKLAVTIAGDGTVQYCGQPELTQDPGNGKIQALSAKECQ